MPPLGALAPQQNPIGVLQIFTTQSRTRPPKVPHNPNDTTPWRIFHGQKGLLDPSEPTGEHQEASRPEGAKRANYVGTCREGGTVPG